jgi:hypothetical protein
MNFSGEDNARARSCQLEPAIRNFLLTDNAQRDAGEAVRPSRLLPATRMPSAPSLIGDCPSPAPLDYGYKAVETGLQLFPFLG